MINGIGYEAMSEMSEVKRNIYKCLLLTEADGISIHTQYVYLAIYARINYLVQCTAPFISIRTPFQIEEIGC